MEKYFSGFTANYFNHNNGQMQVIQEEMEYQRAAEHILLKNNVDCEIFVEYGGSLAITVADLVDEFETNFSRKAYVAYAHYSYPTKVAFYATRKAGESSADVADYYKYCLIGAEGILPHDDCISVSVRTIVDVGDATLDELPDIEVNEDLADEDMGAPVKKTCTLEGMEKFQKKVSAKKTIIIDIGDELPDINVNEDILNYLTHEDIGASVEKKCLLEGMKKFQKEFAWVSAYISIYYT